MLLQGLLSAVLSCAHVLYYHACVCDYRNLESESVQEDSVFSPFSISGFYYVTVVMNNYVLDFNSLNE